MNSPAETEGVEVDKPGCANTVRSHLAAAWRFSLLRLLAFATITSAALAFAKYYPNAAVIPGVLWLIGSLFCLRAGDSRDTGRLLATAFAWIFFLFEVICLIAVILNDL